MNLVLVFMGSLLLITIASFLISGCSTILESSNKCRASITWGLNDKIAGINVCGAKKLISKDPKQVVIAVIDTGVDFSHPKLKKFMHPSSIDLETRSSITTFDDNTYASHGTHVTGVIGAVSDLVFGEISPIKIISIKSLWKKAEDSGLNFSPEAFRYAIDHGAKIINYSAGGQGMSKKELSLIQEANKKGILVVVAAGNDGEVIGGKSKATGSTYSYYPAAHNTENMISVANVDRDGFLNEKSNYGPKVDIAAPGTDINSTILEEDMDIRSGTSVGAPFVTAVAAILLSQDPALTPSQIKKIIKESASLKTNLTGLVDAGGIVNAEGSLQLLKRSSKQNSNSNSKFSVRRVHP